MIIPHEVDHDCPECVQAARDRKATSLVPQTGRRMKNQEDCPECLASQSGMLRCRKCLEDLFLETYDELVRLKDQVEKGKATVFRQVYVYKGQRYEILGLGKMKHPETRAWIPSVFYRTEFRRGYEHTFSRSAEEFFKRFEFVECTPMDGDAP